MNQAPFAIVHDQHGEALCDEHQFAEFAGLGWQRKDKPVVKVEDEGEEEGEEEDYELMNRRIKREEEEERSEEEEVRSGEEEGTTDEVEETKPVIKSGKASKSKAKKDHDDNGVV